MKSCKPFANLFLTTHNKEKGNARNRILISRFWAFLIRAQDLFLSQRHLPSDVDNPKRARPFNIAFLCTTSIKFSAFTCLILVPIFCRIPSDNPCKNFTTGFHVFFRQIPNLKSFYSVSCMKHLFCKKKKRKSN